MIHYVIPPRSATRVDHLVLPRSLCALEHGSILPGLVSLADFIVAASEFAVNEVERRFRIYGNLKHLSSLSKSAFVTKDVAKIFRNVDFMWRGRESLLEDLDSGFGCDSE